MSAPTDSDLRELRGPLLRSVSRSFYLSIRVLPAKLRDPIALAYLLARATDTIADTSEIKADVRRQHLEILAEAIQSRSAGIGVLVESFASLQTHAAERALIERLPECLAWLDAMPPDDRADVRGVLLKINEGQALDLERFGSSEIAALPTAAELHRYTYLVAGSVGEFWTSICARHLRQFASMPNERMRELAVAFGHGLQLINILRDFGPDVRAARCYLPADELHSLGVAAGDLRQHPAAALPVVNHWRGEAEEGVAAGIEYACAIRSWRVRLGTALPALIGARTLALLRDAGAASLEHKVKVSRREVRGILVALVLSAASPRVIREKFAQLSR